jgi:hypothetical protein
MESRVYSYVGYSGGGGILWKEIQFTGHQARCDKLTHTVLLRDVRRLLQVFTANVLPSMQNLVSLIMEAIRSSETSVLTRATWR